MEVSSAGMSYIAFWKLSDWDRIFHVAEERKRVVLYFIRETFWIGLDDIRSGKGRWMSLFFVIADMLVVLTGNIC